MRQGTLTIQQDGTLTIAQGVPGDATAVEAAVATFAERVSATETQVSYRLTAAAVSHARRTGQTLADIRTRWRHTVLPRCRPKFGRRSHGGASRLTG